MQSGDQTIREEEITYFVPGQVAFLLEHDGAPDPGALVKAVQDHPLIRQHDEFRAAQFDTRQRVLTFAPPEGTRRPEQQDGEYRQWRRPKMRSLLPFGRREPSQRLREAHTVIFADLPVESDLLGLVAELDRELRRYEALEQDVASLRAVTLNWLSAGAPHHIGTGGPGARPVSVQLDTTAPWTSASADVPEAPFSFTLPPALSATAPGNGVHVAILDAAPTPKDMKTAFDDWGAQHPILRGLLGPTGTLPSERLSLEPGDTALFDWLNSDEDRFFLNDHRYEMADHGLFIAGIIHSIAPKATLHLVRVLNNYGVGTLETILRGLQAVRDKWDRSGPLIVNMSLTLSLPLKGHRQPQIGPERLFADSAFVERMGWPLEWTCDMLDEEDVMIVAAAGNDGEPGNRPYARQPAAYDSVIGVGALRKDGQPADYSNLADRPSRIGIATFGGDASGPGRADAEKGMLGAYIGEFPDGSSNDNGWARWAGTSFAAPAITGALARLRSTVYTPADALRKVYDAQADVTPQPGLEEVLTIDQGSRRP